ncbi:MAG: DUF2065 domain-containing protein [Hydrocarboniphaga effusa]|nr:DUF2065 domain-containing protein [Hydrocarboniphaga effusa]
MDAPNWQDLVRAFALVLVLEGLWPFLSPARWRTAFLRITTLDDRVLRTFGLASMICGLIVLQLS